MALDGMIQPEIIQINDRLRLRMYDGNYEIFLSGYQDPYVYQNSEGIFDESRIPDLEYVHRMCSYLEKVGELYYIEMIEEGCYLPIGDVTIKQDNPPIAIWNENYRGKGVGKQVLETVIGRLRALGYMKITGSTIYRWNTASRKLHERLGFTCIGVNDKEYIYELNL